MHNESLDLKAFLDECKEHIKLLKNPKTFIKEIPNLLTASRLLSPFIIIPLVIAGLPLQACIAVAAFGFTDQLDGLAAKILNARSDFGKRLDYTVDKIFAISLLIPSTLLNLAVLPILLLELSIGATGLYLSSKGFNIKPNWFGKFKTWGVFSSIAATFLTTVIPGLNVISLPLIFITILLQIIASCFYLNDQIKKSKEKNNDFENELVEEPIVDAQKKKNYAKEKVITPNVFPPEYEDSKGSKQKTLEFPSKKKKY